MPDTYIDLVPENLANEHLCCIIRAKPNPGITAKRAWLSARLPEGHVFRKLDVKDCVFIEYAPLETAWVPVVGDNWLYIYCLWVASTQKGHGYGSALLESHVIVSSSAMSCESSLLSGSTFVNGKYYISLLNSLLGRESNFSITAKTLDTTTLTMTNFQILSIGAVFAIIIPLALLVVGVVVWLRRRHK